MNSRRPFSTAALAAWFFACLAVPNAHGAVIDLATPAGLNPGDQFRFVFVTSGQFGSVLSPGTIQAKSGDISVYNSYVNADAGGATYDGTAITWAAIGSTATVSARVNVGGYNSSVPIYLVDGTRIADNLTTATGGFWSGSLLGSTKINLTISGSQNNSRTWTGSTNDGLPSADRYLGCLDYTVDGSSARTTDFIDYQDEYFTDYGPMFAMSGDLTVAAVPEPTSYAMALAGIACGGYSMWRRWKRA